MAITPKLELRQGQSLVMTQQLQQSIKLLQLSSLELQDYIAQEMEKNPLLAVEEGSTESQVDEPAAADNDAEGDSVDYGESRDFESINDGYSNEGEEKWEPDNGMTSAVMSTGGGSKHTSFDDEDYNYENVLAEKKSLQEHLLDQLHVVVESPDRRIIGRHLIDMVDEAGYIKDDLSQLALLLGCDVPLIEETLATLQTFDPPGICARNLPECLALQLKEKDRLDPAMASLLANLEVLARGDIETLKKRCEVDAEDIQEMVAEIRALNPKPGLNFSHEISQVAQPDIFLRKQAGGGWKIELNNDVLPKVLINQHYYTELSGKVKGKEDKKYLSEQLATANWLVKALDQRAKTILKVATEIVKQQDEFFRKGIRFLKPLTLKDIAQAVEMHESTVSRVTTQKYIATGRGLYELKYFFTSSVQSSVGGEDVSSRAVQFMIKELVDKELSSEILSDDAIVNLLKVKGIELARRTVTKYREAMNIPSSVVRRREKAMVTNF